MAGVSQLNVAAAERKFEAMVTDGTPVEVAARASGLRLGKALQVSDRLAAQDYGGLLNRRWAERTAEQWAALYGFYVSQRAEIMEDIAYARKMRDDATTGDSVLDKPAAVWQRQITSLRADLRAVEERLRALGARRPNVEELSPAELEPPPPVLPPEDG